MKCDCSNNSMFTGFAYVAEAMAIILACKRLIYAYQGKFDSHIGQHVQTYLMLMAQVVLAHSDMSRACRSRTPWVCHLKVGGLYGRAIKV